jgi:hypothetical protein
MTRLDPQRITGLTPYQPPAPPCTCTDLEAVHALKRGGGRGPCTAGRAAGPCGCSGYRPVGAR